MDPSELEFLVEDKLISIIPNFSSRVPTHLISGSIEPFRAGLPLYVPLWLAVHLRKQQKCRLVPPSWMDKEFLTELKESEKGLRTFTKLPSEHYIIEANLILQCAPEDVVHSDEIRTLIKDVADTRAAKIRTSIDDFMKGEGTYAKLNNLTVFEIHSLRHLLPLSLNVIDQIYQVNVSQ